MALKALLTKKERYLLRKQNCFVLNESEPAEEDVDQGSVDSESSYLKALSWWDSLITDSKVTEKLI